jgi:hypothetical protein
MDYDKTLDIDKEFNQKKKKYDREFSEQQIKNFNNKIEYRTTLLNIDSKFRNMIPKNIYSSTNIKLNNNPIYTTKNSNIIKINYPNHNFKINDNIIIYNAIGKIKNQNNCIYFLNNYNYALINFNDHNIGIDYLSFVNNYQINLEIINDINIVMYNNIPINAIFGIQNIYLPSLINQTNPIPIEILNILNVTSIEELDPNYLLIKLPYNAIINGVYYYTIPDLIKITILSIGGIALPYINSDYPINYERYQGYLNIVSLDNDNIYLETSVIAAQTEQSGGNNIQIMLITNTLAGYPYANSYSIALKKNFNNIVRIELISTEFPYIDFLVKKNKNNKLYWKHYDDGNHIYNIEIPEGNYNATSLVSTITTYINNIPRLESTNENPVYNIFNISLDTFTQEIKFKAFKLTKLPNCITASLIEINNIKYILLTFYHPGNLVEIGDTIIVSGAEMIGNIIHQNYINTTLIVYEINTTDLTYSVLLSPLNQITNLSSFSLIGTGGPSIVIQTPAKVSFLFNYQDTLGTILGFKNVSQLNAITSYKTIISNFDNYIQYTNLNQVGNLNTSSILLNLSGYNYYILMYLNDFKSILNNSNCPDAFAKILMSGNPGDILFNSFINYPLEFDLPIPYLNELNISFTYPDSTPVDFRNIDHSFTLRIIEKIIIPTNTGLNSKYINVIDTLKYDALNNIN